MRNEILDRIILLASNWDTRKVERFFREMGHLAKKVIVVGRYCIMTDAGRLKTKAFSREIGYCKDHRSGTLDEQQ